MKKIEDLTFNEFCEKYCDRLYTPGLGDESQASGYKLLKQMVLENITPVSIEETEKFKRSPNNDELDLKYLLFLHPILRPYIIEKWETIKQLKL